MGAGATRDGLAPPLFGHPAERTGRPIFDNSTVKQGAVETIAVQGCSDPESLNDAGGGKGPRCCRRSEDRGLVGGPLLLRVFFHFAVLGRLLTSGTPFDECGRSLPSIPRRQIAPQAQTIARKTIDPGTTYSQKYVRGRYCGPST